MLRRSFPLPFLAVILVAACSTEPDPGGEPTGGLAIDSTVPSTNATGGEYTTTVKVYFDRALDPATVTGNTIGVLFPNGATVQGSVAYDDATHSVAINLPLMPAADYRGVATTSVRGTAGESLSGTFTWDFRTRATTRVIVDQAVGLATRLELVVDAGGVTHAAYVDSTTAQVRYARCASACLTAANWTAGAVGGGAGAESRIDLAVSPTGSPVVAFYAGTTGDLVVATCAGTCAPATGWTLATVDGAGADVGFNPSLAIGSGGVIHALYYDRTAGNLRYASCPAGCGSAAAWSAPITLDPGGTRGKVSDLAIGDGGRLIAAWTSGLDNGTVYGSCQTNCAAAAGWSIVPLPATAGFTTRVQVAADSGRRPVILFGIADITVTATCLAVTCTTDANWAYVGLGQDASFEGFPVIGIGAAGRMHVAYASTFRGFRYLSCTHRCEQASGWWTAGNLDINADVYDGALAVEAGGAAVGLVRLESGKPAYLR